MNASYMYCRQKALTILGFAPCHHMASLFEDPSLSLAWYGAFNGKPTDFRRLMRGYRATCDNPGADFVPELMEAFPNAKVILTVRDTPEAWWNSMENTVYPMTGFQYGISVFPIGFLRKQWFVTRYGILKRFKERYGTDRGPEVYVRHNEFIRKTVPKEKLLEFNAKQGWEPLCEFLGVPVPEGPYPHVNEAAELKKNIRFAEVLGQATWAVMFGVLGVTWYVSTRTTLLSRMVGMAEGLYRKYF